MLHPTTLTLAEAQAILRGFMGREQTDRTLPGASTESVSPSSSVVQQALQLLTARSDYQMLGVCAETATAGYQALERYLKALGYPADYELSQAEEPVYIKFNSKTGRCYLEPYAGHHRGVLVSCQSSEPEGINETFGHLPLDLFDA